MASGIQVPQQGWGQSTAAMRSLMGQGAGGRATGTRKRRKKRAAAGAPKKRRKKRAASRAGGTKLKKGSAAAKAWGAKMRRLRKG